MSKPQESTTNEPTKKAAGRGRRRRWLVMVGIVGILGAGAFVAQQMMASDPDTALAAQEEPESDEEEVTRVPVALARATESTLPFYFHATGTLEARRRVDLISKTQGQITRLRVEEGDRVKAGQVLLEIDHRESKLLVEEARVRAETAKLELSRIEDMAKRGLETDRAFEEAKQAAQVNQAQYELAQVRLDDHILRAPFDGHVTVRHVELGQTVQVSVPLVGIADAAPLEVRLFLPEQIVHRLQVGQPVEIRPDVAEGVMLEGRVARIAPVVDSATSTVKVTLTVVGGADVARVGSFVRARITTDVHENVVAVPKKAIVAEAGANFLFLAEADTVRRVDVTTGYANDDWIEIEAGVVPGDQVVVVGQGGLREGSVIEELGDEKDESSSENADESEDEAPRVAHGK